MSGGLARAVSCKAMRLIPILTAAAILACTAAPAVAQDASLFGYFKAVCAPGTDPDAGAARALAQGFAPAKKKPKMGELDDVKGFEKTVGGRDFFVVVGRGKGKAKDGMPPSATTACGVGVKGKDEAGLAAGRKWVGVPSSKTVMGIAFHAFRQSGGARAALSFDDKPAVKAALLAADLNVLTITGLGGNSLLLLTRTRPA